MEGESPLPPPPLTQINLQKLITTSWQLQWLYSLNQILPPQLLTMNHHLGALQLGIEVQSHKFQALYLKVSDLEDFVADSSTVQYLQDKVNDLEKRIWSF